MDSDSSEEGPTTYADYDNSTDFWEVEVQDFLGMLNGNDDRWTVKIMSKEDMQDYHAKSLLTYIKAAGYATNKKTTKKALEQFADREENQFENMCRYIKNVLVKKAIAKYKHMKKNGDEEAMATTKLVDDFKVNMLAIFSEDLCPEKKKSRASPKKSRGDSAKERAEGLEQCNGRHLMRYAAITSIQDFIKRYSDEERTATGEGTCSAVSFAKYVLGNEQTKDSLENRVKYIELLAKAAATLCSVTATGSTPTNLSRYKYVYATQMANKEWKMCHGIDVATLGQDQILWENGLPCECNF